jgi:hypothetical protein
LSADRFLSQPIPRSADALSSFFSLMAGIALNWPFDESFRPILTEFLSKLPRSPRHSDCRAALERACGRADSGPTVRDEVAAVRALALADDFEITTLSELRICESACGESGEFGESAVQRLQILRTDPGADIRITGLIGALAVGDFEILVNRVDRLKGDVESWKCLSEFVQGERMNEESMIAMRRYVGGYWRKYHGRREVEPFAETYRRTVLSLVFQD